LRDGDDALLVNWCELTVSRPDDKVVYNNAFATNYTIRTYAPKRNFKGSSLSNSSSASLKALSHRYFFV
jgi:hypothetical protein